MGVESSSRYNSDDKDGSTADSSASVILVPPSNSSSSAVKFATIEISSSSGFPERLRSSKLMRPLRGDMSLTSQVDIISWTKFVKFDSGERSNGIPATPKRLDESTNVLNAVKFDSAERLETRWPSRCRNSKFVRSFKGDISVIGGGASNKWVRCRSIKYSKFVRSLTDVRSRVAVLS